MMTKRALAGAILSLCAFSPAYAAPDGWYLSLEGGAGIVEDWEHTRTKWTWCGPEVKDALASFDTGFAAFGSAGYSIRGWRIEVEGGYRENDLDSYVKEHVYAKETVLLRYVREFMTPTTYEKTGDLREASVMINVLYDVPLFDRLSLSVGVGAGADFAQLRINTKWSTVLDDDDWRFAYQGIAGLNYAITEMTAVFIAYRYLNVTDVGFESIKHVQFDGEDIQKQAATAGFRFALNAPPAPPLPPAPDVPPPPVPLEREFMVFFGFNKSNLTQDALDTIRRAVGAVQESGSASIRVVGHADRAGSVRYNKVLSLRRAKSVKKALISEGIAGDSISISGRGESEPMVPTADGAREPQNRRVHISF